MALLFGGLCGGPDDGNADKPFKVHNDTWTFDDKRNWRQINPTVVPPNRFMHAMANGLNGTAIVWGGLSAAVKNNKEKEQAGALGDLWIYRNSTEEWAELAQTASSKKDGTPSARSFHKMAVFKPDSFDTSKSPLIVMFGGRKSNNKDTNETWVLDITHNTGKATDTLQAQWFLVKPTVAPSKRTGHAMSRLGKNSVVLFGGYDAATQEVLGDTWVFVGAEQKSASWINVQPKDGALSTAASVITGVEYPPARRFASFGSFDSETAMMFGGSTETNFETNRYSPFSDGSVWHLSRNTDNISVPVNKRCTCRLACCCLCLHFSTRPDCY